MRRKPLTGGLMGSRSRVLGACVTVLVGIWLGSIQAAPAGAACPNAQFRSGPSEHLPDCRAYEQVSPVEKGGLDAVTFEPTFPVQAATCESSEGCAIAYMNVGGAFAGAQGNDVPNAYLATRGADGWQTVPLTPPSVEAPANSKAKVSYAFSASLSQTVLRVPLQQLTPASPGGVYNLFVRQLSGSYSLVTANAPASPPEAGCGDCFENEDVPAFAGASSDFSHILFEADDSLVEGAPGGGVENLYETTDAHVQLVGILPDGEIPPNGATAGGGIDVVSEHAGELDHAISQDGSHVLFEAAADGGAPDRQQQGMTELYDRVAGTSTVEISAPASGAEPEDCETEQRICDPEPARFWAASADGSAIYFTSKAALTRASDTGPEERSEAEKEEEEETGKPNENPGNDLYRYDTNTLTLSDLTPNAGSEGRVGEEPDRNGASVLGVVGASEDGSYVYFVAKGWLAKGAQTGEPNLYVWHETGEDAGTVTFIATLQAPTATEEKNLELMRTGPSVLYGSDLADWTSHPTESQAYVTPDGRHLAFMSVKPLTGYDNDDQATGEPDHEVFEYSTEAGQLVCTSCDPGGASPLGSAFIGARLGGRLSTAFHQPRTLSDDGSRLFFSSPDPLVSGVSGASDKVFEYENGVVQLISGMESGGEAVFLDASASGNDVFFATREELASSDQDELVDVYDARVDGGVAAPPAPVPSCQGSSCQEPFSPAPSFAEPLSASFAVVGDGASSQTPSTAKLTNKQLLRRALARCKRLMSRRRRAACVKRAMRRYAPNAKRSRHSVMPKRSRYPR